MKPDRGGPVKRELQLKGSANTTNKGATKIRKIKMSGEINHDRRRFCGSAAMNICPAQTGMFAGDDAMARPSGPPVTTGGKPTPNTPLWPLEPSLTRLHHA